MKSETVLQLIFLFHRFRHRFVANGRVVLALVPLGCVVAVAVAGLVAVAVVVAASLAHHPTT